MPDDKRENAPTPAYGAVMTSGDAERDRHSAPSAERNLGPILEALRTVAPARGRALEIASGTGQHVVAFAGAFPDVAWTPSDPDPVSRKSIAAWIAHTGARNVAPPLAVDVTEPGWASRIEGPLHLMLATNMIHIAPWAAALGLLAGAGDLLAPGGRLVLYGPFKRGGVHTAPSNAEFDRSLRGRNPAWGVRDQDDVAAAAADAGLGLARTVDMPANNTILVLERGNGG